MKSDKKLIELYNNAKGDKEYFEFEDFKRDIKGLLKDIKHRKLYCSLEVSRSGMTRKFGFRSPHNRTLNIIYNNKVSFEPVKVGGCGMDMGFHLLYIFTNAVLTEKELEKPVRVHKSFTSSWNSLCSDYIVI